MCPPAKVNGVWPFNDASLRTSLEEARRHATLPRSWIQRENWEFETHRSQTAPPQPQKRLHRLCVAPRELGIRDAQALPARWRPGPGRPDVRHHATVPQPWMQRENWEFETHSTARGRIAYLTAFFDRDAQAGALTTSQIRQYQPRRSDRLSSEGTAIRVASAAFSDLTTTATSGTLGRRRSAA